MILHDPATAGPQHPVSPSPDRRPRSIRRTSTIDTNRPAGLDGPPVIEAAARDLWTPPDREARILAAATLSARLSGFDHLLHALHTTPEVPALQDLLGAVVGPGFRAKVDRVVPDLRHSGALLYLLLDDLPGATLVSGYAMLAADAIPMARTRSHDEYLEARGDLCAGWARDGSMMEMIRVHQRQPTPLGPDAPTMGRADDPLAWHAVGPLGPHGTRRMRRLDVWAPDDTDGSVTVDVFFRDTHSDARERETIVHEYSVRATVDTATRTVTAIEATADVLPWRECPGAVGSAARLVGRPLAELRPWVRATFVGTSTCTHLNDVLRGLADVDHLVDLLTESAGRPD
jgi:hypothetical protein